jgi:hypothetical protein
VVVAVVVAVVVGMVVVDMEAAGKVDRLVGLVETLVLVVVRQQHYQWMIHSAGGWEVQ